jgi:SET and MYND domain-containing protein 4
MRAPHQGVDKLVDNGLTLALALWNRSEVLIRSLDGQHALKDLQICAKVGFQAKQNPQYYARMAKCYACE